jgi:dTDP-glucose 4,6-dehydratase
MSSSILLTGALGFIGSALARSWPAQERLVNLDLSTYAGDPRRLAELPAGTVETHRVDVASAGDVEAAVEACRPRWIVHLAAESHVTRSETDPDRFYRTNVEGTRVVLEAAARAGVERVVHVSTDEVYGPCAGPPFSEEAKQPGEGLATSAYARSKALADDLALSFGDRVEVVVVRPTNCFGPWQHPEKAVARWTVRALEGRPLPVWGDGGQIRDWMYVDDACEAIRLVLREGRPGQVYNIGPEAGARTNLEVARAVAAAAGRTRASVELSGYDRPGHDRRYAVDCTRVRELGWTPQVDFDQGVARTVAWYENNSGWWSSMVADAEALYAD